MTSEQRLDRLERIAKLMVRAGLRTRRGMREQDEKIDIIINAQIENEARFARNEERFAELSQHIDHVHSELTQSLARSHNELTQSLARSHNELAKAQIHTDKRLDSLIEIISGDRNGRSN